MTREDGTAALEPGSIVGSRSTADKSGQLNFRRAKTHTWDWPSVSLDLNGPDRRSRFGPGRQGNWRFSIRGFQRVMFLWCGRSETFDTGTTRGLPSIPNREHRTSGLAVVKRRGPDSQSESKPFRLFTVDNWVLRACVTAWWGYRAGKGP